MNQTLVFIVGCPRSGTTFLRNAMAGLSSVFEIARETAFFRNYCGRYGDLRTPSNLSALVRDFTRTRAFAVSQVSPEAFAQALAVEPEMDYGQFFVTFANLSSLARNGVPARIIVEKTPTHAFCIDRIRGTFPEAKFIIHQILTKPLYLLGMAKKVTVLLKEVLHFLLGFAFVPENTLREPYKNQRIKEMARV